MHAQEAGTTLRRTTREGRSGPCAELRVDLLRPASLDPALVTVALMGRGPNSWARPGGGARELQRWLQAACPAWAKAAWQADAW